MNKYPRSIAMPPYGPRFDSKSDALLFIWSCSTFYHLCVPALEIVEKTIGKTEQITFAYRNAPYEVADRWFTGRGIIHRPAEHKPLMPCD